MRQINKVIIHCADTPNHMEFTVTDIREWHEERGWRDVGYHYVIRRDGEIEVGRNESDVGAHCYGHNQDSIGICLIGRDSFTRAQFHSLRKLVDDLQIRYDLDEVAGHNKYTEDKTCPNFSVEDFFEAHE